MTAYPMEQHLLKPAEKVKIVDNTEEAPSKEKERATIAGEFTQTDKKFAMFNEFNSLLTNLGEITEWSESALSKACGEKEAAQSKTLDVDAIHSCLAKNSASQTSKEGNTVMAAFTLVIKINGEKYAITKVIPNQSQNESGNANSSQNANGCKFLSGFKDQNFKDPNADYKHLFSCIRKRLQCSSFAENPRLQKILNFVETHQKTDADFIMKTLESKLASQKPTFCQELVDTIFECHPRGNYGPTMDSEQFLLSKLEKGFLVIQQTQELQKLSSTGEYPSLRSKFSRWFYDQLTKSMAKSVQLLDRAKLTEADQTKKRQNIENEFRKVTDQLNKIQTLFVADHEVLGCFLHVFSQFEFCEFCALSLWCECYEMRSNFVSTCREQMKGSSASDPYFIIFASYGEELHRGEPKKCSDDPQATKRDYSEQRPEGIISEGIAKQYETSYEKLQNIINGRGTAPNLDDIIKEKILPVKLVTKAADGTYKETLKLERDGIICSSK